MWRSILFAFVVLAGAPLDRALAEPGRFALLIGNAGYSKAVGALRNPHNDVALLAATLGQIGFDVTVIRDATYRSLDIEVRRHAMKLRDAGDKAIGFFYYSGHGVANPLTRANYLIPVDVRTIADKDVWLYAFEQKTIIDKLSAIAANATHFVVFDACRDELITPDLAAKSATETKGFVPIATKAGLLVAYSTAPGKTASDEGDGGGPYASILAEELAKPGIEAVAMFRRVQLRVRAKIQQDPWLSFPALPEIYLAGRLLADDTRDSAAARAGPAAQPGDQEPTRMAPMSAAARAWLVTQHSNNAAILEAFAKEFAESIFAKFARARIMDLARRKSVQTSAGASLSQDELRKAQQGELKRLNCYVGSVDGKWGAQSRLAMVRFNQHASTKFDTGAPAHDTLEVLKALKKPICPRSTPTAKPEARGRPKTRHGSSGRPRYAGRGCRRETIWECRRRLCPGGGCGMRGSGRCRWPRRKVICR